MSAVRSVVTSTAEGSAFAINGTSPALAALTASRIMLAGVGLLTARIASTASSVDRFT